MSNLMSPLPPRHQYCLEQMKSNGYETSYHAWDISRLRNSHQARLQTAFTTPQVFLKLAEHQHDQLPPWMKYRPHSGL